jgi:hypothetical protein
MPIAILKSGAARQWYESGGQAQGPLGRPALQFRIGPLALACCRKESRLVAITMTGAAPAGAVARSELV